MSVASGGIRTGFIPLDGRICLQVYCGIRWLTDDSHWRRNCSCPEDASELDCVYAERQGASALAGFIQATKRQLIPPGSTVVCYITGIDLKDTIGWQYLTYRTIADGKLVKVRPFEL